MRERGGQPGRGKGGRVGRVQKAGGRAFYMLQETTLPSIYFLCVLRKKETKRPGLVLEEEEDNCKTASSMSFL